MVEFVERLMREGYLAEETISIVKNAPKKL